MKRSLLLLPLLCNSLYTYSQQLEEIIVTAQRDSDSYYDIPAITITKNADFFVQRIRLINDSRSPDLRKQELIGSIDNLIKASAKIKGMELSYGDGFLVPVNLNDDSLQIIEDTRRTDTSYVDISVKTAMNEKESPKQQIVSLRKFISSANLLSRTEIESIGDIGLSIVKPEQYRYEILKKVVAENKKIQEVVGGDCEIKIGGLEGRVNWERSGVSELTLYIGYATEVACK